MKREHLFVMILVAFVLIAAGSPRRQVFDAPLVPVGSATQLSVNADATPETLTVPTGATVVRIQPTDGIIRWDDSQTAGYPTTSTGEIVYAGQVLVYSDDLANWEACSVSGTVVCEVKFYHY